MNQRTILNNDVSAGYLDKSNVLDCEMEIAQSIVAANVELYKKHLWALEKLTDVLLQRYKASIQRNQYLHIKWQKYSLAVSMGMLVYSLLFTSVPKDYGPHPWLAHILGDWCATFIIRLVVDLSLFPIRYTGCLSNFLLMVTI